MLIKKHETVDEFSRRFRIASNDIDEINEINIDDFINVEINCVQIAFCNESHDVIS